MFSKRALKSCFGQLYKSRRPWRVGYCPRDLFRASKYFLVVHSKVPKRQKGHLPTTNEALLNVAARACAICTYISRGRLCLMRRRLALAVTTVNGQTAETDPNGVYFAAVTTPTWEANPIHCITFPTLCFDGVCVITTSEINSKIFLMDQTDHQALSVAWMVRYSESSNIIPML